MKWRMKKAKFFCQNGTLRERCREHGMAGPADCSTFAAASRMYPARVYEWLTINSERESDKMRSLRVPAVATVGALAVGAVAIGALAVGAMAIGRLAIRRVAIKQARIGRLEVDELVIKRIEQPE
jgi:hypothetical protein